MIFINRKIHLRSKPCEEYTQNYLGNNIYYLLQNEITNAKSSHTDPNECITFGNNIW